MKGLKLAIAMLLVLLIVGCSARQDKNVNEDPGNGQEVPGGTEGETEDGGIPFKDPVAEMHIKDYGVIKIRLFPEIAPKAVENFITHAQNGYYEGVIFHRVIEDFMIQGGDPTGTGRGGESIWGGSFEDEFSLEAFPRRGALAMANSGPNTNGSQFFIVQTGEANEYIADQMRLGGWPEELIEEYLEFGGTPHLFLVHTVFGQVYEGMDVVDAIAATEVDNSDKPLSDVVIEFIEIKEYTE